MTFLFDFYCIPLLYFQFMAELIPMLREDPIFGDLLDDIHLVGSAPLKLRVGTFDEFDVNIVLKKFSRLPDRLEASTYRKLKLFLRHIAHLPSDRKLLHTEYVVFQVIYGKENPGFLSLKLNKPAFWPTSLAALYYRNEWNNAYK